MHNSAPRSVRTPRVSDQRVVSPPRVDTALSMSDSLEMVVPQFDDKFCDCFAIFACEDAGTEAKLFPDEVAEQMDRVQGRYWKIGEVHGSAVYRQECDGGSDGGLYIYKDEKDGWMCAGELFSTSDSCKVAWLGREKPVAVHIPFYAKKRHRNITVEPQHKYADSVMCMMREDCSKMAALIQDPADAAQVEDLADAAPADAAGEGKWSAPSSSKKWDRHDPTAAASASTDGHKHSQPSGWLNKCAALVNLIVEQKDWEQAEVLAQSYYDQDSMANVRNAKRSKARRYGPY